MDVIPDEFLQKILNYAMIRDALCYLEACFRLAEIVKRQNNRVRHHDAEKLERPSSSLYNEPELGQKEHISDWHAVVGTSRRLRRVGESAFFSHKTFIIGRRLASQLQNLQVALLSIEDQQIAISQISSIIWIQNSTTSPSSFLKLPRYVSAFPRLIRLDLLFGYRHGEPESLLMHAARERRQAWSHLTDALALLGVPVGKLDVGIMISPDTMWGQYERGLGDNIYPALRAIVSLKEKAAQKQN